jgi:hypothetical protein
MRKMAEEINKKEEEEGLDFSESPSQSSRSKGSSYGKKSEQNEP